MTFQNCQFSEPKKKPNRNSKFYSAFIRFRIKISNYNNEWKVNSLHTTKKEFYN